MKKYLILTIILFLFLSAFFTVKATFPESFYFVSSFFIMLFALPSFYILIKLLGLKKGFMALLIMGSFAVALETLAIKTGFPYGKFEYGSRIGWKIFDTIPWTLPFAYIPLVIGTVTIARKIAFSTFSVVGISTLLLVLTDLVIDPGAVSMKFWTYQNGGSFYNVPLSNFIGWTISGFIGSLIFYGLMPKNKELPKGLLYSYFGILTFWTSISFWNFLIISTAIGIGLLIFTIKFLKD